MLKKSKHLNVLQNNTCFATHANNNVCCERKNCDQWIDYKDGCNCVLVSASKRAYTLQEIGEIYGLTRMRICQIEKNIYEKIRSMS